MTECDGLKLGRRRCGLKSILGALEAAHPLHQLGAVGGRFP